MRKIYVSIFLIFVQNFNMKKILLLGSAIGDVPIVEAAKRLGYYTITLSLNKNGEVHKYSDKYIYADYTNVYEVLKVN